MSNSKPTVLDQIDFTFQKLPEIDAASSPVITPFAISVVGAERKLRIPVPLVVRRLGPAEFSKQWNVFCEELQEASIPIYSSAQEFEKLPATSIPLRFSRLYSNSPLHAAELKSADAVEIVCKDQNTNAWGWSLGSGPEKIPAFVKSLRLACGGDTPIGIALPTCSSKSDIQVAINSGCDFLTLVGNRESVTAQDLACIVQARQASCSPNDNALPIIVDLQISHGGDVAKLLALGATIVTIDNLLKPTLPNLEKTEESANSLGVGMLSGIAVPTTSDKIPLRDTSEAIARLVNSNQQLVTQIGLERLSPNCLMTVCRDLSEALGIPLLRGEASN